MGLFDGWKRRVKLFEAYRFGREFYGIDLEKVNRPVMSQTLARIEMFGDPVPQVIFFMIVPAFIGVIQPLKALELLDGIQSLRLRGLVADEIYDNFMRKFEKIDPDDPTKWAREALGD